MRNPFPGVDPFLEAPAFWRDFQQSFLTYWRDWLLDHLPDHYEVRIDERVGVVAGGVTLSPPKLPDLSILQIEALPRNVPEAETTAVLENEPTSIQVAYVEEEVDTYLRIMYRPDASLITVLDLLSPTNKTDPGRLVYLGKRNEYLREAVHLVELDLLRGGVRLPTVQPLPPGDYYALVAWGEQRPNAECYAWTLRAPLPRIRIPLRPPDPDIVFDLPGLYALAYNRGRYARALRHGEAPPVPFNLADQQWVAERLRGFGAADR